jgi:histidinol dehydrogenase
MLRRLDLRGVEDPAPRIPRPGLSGDLPLEAVRSIVAEVRERGDAALRELTGRLDGVEVSEIRVSPEQLAQSLEVVPGRLREALQSARASILAYQSQRPPDPAPFRRGGLEVTEVRRPVARAGLYVPGGKACYPSSVLMTAVPARVAGVPEIALCVPPDASGSVAAPTLAAAAIAGVDEVYSVGGAQAIAALAYGTESIRAVDVIAGPGNVYVSLAEREVAGVVGVPSSFAGPSEVVVVADGSAPPRLAALDIVVQAEHGPDGLAWLVTWSEEVAHAVSSEVASLVEGSPRRDQITSTLRTQGYAVIVDGPQEAMRVANLVAPEHLELICEGAGELVPLVQNAGAVFLGPWSPASVGDYLAGPSHVLPTFGSARFASALGPEDFQKRIHVVSLDEGALGSVAADVATIAEAEGLAAHAESVRARSCP